MRSVREFGRPFVFGLTFCLIVIGVAAVSSVAVAQSGVALLDERSLIGWTYGAGDAEGWTVEGGRLSGSADCAPLLSGYTSGDFELRFDWSVESDGAIELTFPEVPNGKGLTLALREGDGCGRLTDGGRQIQAGVKLAAIEGDAQHRAVIEREGNRLSLSVDGEKIYDAKLGGAADRRFGLGIAVTKGNASVADLRALQPVGAEPFNGENLDGWQCRQNLGAWKADKGELCLTGGGGSYIQTSRLYSNFTLSCEVLIRRGGNSGFGIRTLPEGWPSGDGMEIQILDSDSLGKSSYLSIYGNVPPIAIAHKSEEYNEVVIKADGWIISGWMNGRLVLHVDTKNHPELKHRNLTGWIGFQDHGAWIRVRNLRVLEAPDGEGLDAWYAPKPPHAAAAIVDRMMNTEDLTVDHGIRARSVVTTVEEAEVVLADLAGPGAVTRVANLGDGGRLAFYFDGEEKPRIECKPSDLQGKLPRIGESARPQPTCVTFARSLKIVLVGGGDARYDIDYVTFPDTYKIESYRDAKSGFPLGWLDASIYRTHRFRVGFGGARQYDPLERIDVGGKKIGPGESVEMISADGSGVAAWSRFFFDRKVLDGDTLWLEVTIDGEAKPAISLPLRFWLAGLAGSGNYSNLIWLHQKGSGMQNMLAMPFSDGIRFSLTNKGEMPIEGVGMLVGIDRIGKEEVRRRSRLRSVSAQGAEAIEIDGRGRLVGLLGQDPPDQLVVKADGRQTTIDTGLWLGGDDPFHASFSGRSDNGLYWRWLIGEPIDFEKQFRLEVKGESKQGASAAIFYIFP